MRCTKPFSATRLPRLLAVFLVVASLLTVFATFRLNTQTATAATNNTMNFQARLMQANGAIVPDGDYNVEFKVYNTVTSSGSTQGSCSGDATCLWTETRVSTDKVRVVNGYLTVNLGSVTALPAINWDQELWLTMNIGGTGTPGWDGEMSPRLKLTAVPYAFMAGQLAATNGSFRSNLSFVQPTANRSVLIPDASGTICLQNSVSCGFMTGSAADFIQNQNSIDQSANFRISGTGRANTSIMTPILQPTADGTTALKIQNIAGTVTAMVADTTNGRITVGANTAAQETLDVVGNLQVRDATTATKSYRLRTSGGALDFEAAGASLVLSTWSGAGYTGTQYNQITFKSDGSSMDFARGFNIGDAAARVGLAGNVNPQYSLDVNGDINTSTQYRIGGTVICTATGCTPAAGSGNYIQNNQTASPQSANIFIQNAGANSADTATLKLGASQTGAALNITDSSNNSLWKVTSGVVAQTVGLRISVNSTTADTFVTPVGSSVKSAINIPLYDPGASGQLLAFGLPSGAQTTSRAISVFDARTSGVIQPAIALFSPNENEVFGLSWNGLNTVASLESSGSTAIALRPGGVNVKLWAGSTGVAIGSNVSSASYPLDVTGDINTSTQYRIAGTVICTASGCTPASGSGNYIQNQNSSDQTANFRIDGTGRAGTALQAPLFDTPTAATLNIGTTNATSIELRKSTVITGGLTQSTGAVSLTANNGSSFTTSAGSLTITAAATSTWSTSGGALTIQSATTNALNLRTGGAGTVAVGDINSTTIQIGRGSNIARTIHIGNAGTSTAQTIVMGSTGSTSTTTIQGGTGTSAIALATGTNGGIALTSNGTGTINLTSGTGGTIVKPTADTGSAFQVQNAGGSYIFNVNSTFGVVNIGLLNVGIGTNTGYIDTTNAGDTITIGATNANTVSIGRTAAAVTIQGSAASTFKATSGSFTTTLGFITPTANRAINLPDESGTVCLQSSVNCGFLTGSAANYIQNTTTLQSANIAVQAAASGSVAAVLQANVAGTGDILSLRNGAGTAVATFGYDGQVLFKNSTNSTTAFQVQNAAGTSVLMVDTTNQRVAIGNTTPALKFEVQGGDAAIYNSGNSARLVLGDSSTSGQYGWLQWDSANDYFRIETVGSNGLKINDNNVSIGNIFPSKPLIVGSGTVPLFEIGATGQVQTRTSTNSMTAFQIQDNLGDVYLNADSTNKRIGIGDGMAAPEVTLDVKGVIQQTGLQTSDTGAADNNKWTKLGSCTITAQYDQCLTKIEILGGQDGSAGNNSQATVAVRVKQQNALGGVPYVNVTLNDTAEVITKSDIVAVTTVNNGTTTTVELYARITNTFETWYYTPVLNTGGYGESTWNWTPFSAFGAALPGGTQTVARYGNLNANLMMVEATDTNAFTVQNAGGANKLLVANTNLMRLAVNQATAAYTLDVAGDVNTTTQYRVGGAIICTATGCTASAASAILNQATVQASNFYVQAATSGSVAGILRANAAGAGDILQLKNGAGTNVAVFGSAGAVTLQNTTNSTAAFQVVALNTNTVMRVDTTNERVAIGVISDPISAKLNIATGSTVSLRAYQGSTFDAFQLANSTGDIFNVSDTGEVRTKTTTNSADAFEIQNTGGTQVFNVDTIENEVFLGSSYSGKHFAANLNGNAFIEVGNSTGEGVGLTQVEGGPAYLSHSTDLIIQREVSNSTTALQVLDASDNDLLVVNSTDNHIQIGESNTTGTILVLDTKTGAGDPTGVDGAMYYNSSSKAFRCYSNGNWRSCAAGVVFANTSVPAGNTVANTVTETNFASNYSIPANDCQPGRVYKVTAQGVYGTTTTAPTLNIRVKLGTTALVATGAQTTTISMTNREWRVEFQFICISTGAAGTVEAGGAFTRFTSAIASVLWEMSNTAVVPSINTTTAQTLQISAQFGTANAANTITMRQLIVEASGP